MATGLDHQNAASLARIAKTQQSLVDLMERAVGALESQAAWLQVLAEAYCETHYMEPGEYPAPLPGHLVGRRVENVELPDPAPNGTEAAG